MRVLMLSKAAIVGQYQSKLTGLASQPDLELTVAVPPEWRDERGALKLERTHLDGYRLEVIPIRLNGHFHLHYYPTLPALIARAQPDILHLDEEPYNLATYLALRSARVRAPRARVVFFTWQNLMRRYPPPFSWIERYTYRHSDAAIAGSQDACRILQAKGYARSISLIPQFGVPPVYAPAPPRERGTLPIVVGYAGRLVPEKGVELLLRALARVERKWTLRVLGSGPLRRPLAALADQLGIVGRVEFTDWVPSIEMPQFYNSLDLLVVPSLTQPNWKEQFGRVLIEAMACGIPVIGSSSGEIPNVLGDAGLVFPEGDVPALAAALRSLIDAPALRSALGQKGRELAVTRYSQTRVVDDTYALYRDLLRGS